MIKWVDQQTGIYLNNSIQAHHIFDFMMSEMLMVDQLVISSFAITEAWVRRLIRNREKIRNVVLFLDFTVASRKPRNTDYTAQNVNELWLTTNHSKTIYMKNETAEILALMSNNATNNKRFESGVVFRNHPAIKIYLEELENMKLNSVQWNA
jgi:hypothetical protein